MQKLQGSPTFFPSVMDSGAEIRRLKEQIEQLRLRDEEWQREIERKREEERLRSREEWLEEKKRLEEEKLREGEEKLRETGVG